MRAQRLNMKAERVRKGLTIEQLGDIIGVSSNAISKWENSKASPTASNLVALCNLYGVSPEYLLDMTSDEHGAVVVT